MSFLYTSDYAQNKGELHELVDVREYKDGDETKRIGVAKFSNMQEYVAFYESIKDDDRAIDDKRRDDVQGSKHTWTFGKATAYGRSKAVAPLRTIEGVLETAKNGNCHNVFSNLIDTYRDKVNADNIGALQDDVKSVKRVTRFTDDGGELDIDRVMCGDMDYWRTTKRDGEYRVVRLVINFGMSSGNSTEKFMELLAMTYVMAELIEKRGYGVEIYGCDAVHTMRTASRYLSEQSTLIPLKLVQEHLDVERIGVVGIVGFFRHVDFIVCNKLFGYSNGNCLGTTKPMQAFLGADVFIENSWLGSQQSKKITKALETIERGC